MLARITTALLAFILGWNAAITWPKSAHER